MVSRSSRFQMVFNGDIYSMILQSFFAFGFFVRVFIPFYIATVTLGHRRGHLQKGQA